MQKTCVYMENMHLHPRHVKICKIKICDTIYLSMIDENPFTACNCLYKYEHALYAKFGLY